jgi:hypothetical protein
MCFAHSGTASDALHVQFITHKNGRVSRFRDYMNPLRLQSA